MIDHTRAVRSEAASRSRVDVWSGAAGQPLRRLGQIAIDCEILASIRSYPRNTFYTELPDGTVQAWSIREPSDPQANSETHEARKQYASNYWIATVPPEIIKDHLDIWSDPAIEMLAGIYRIAEQLSTMPPPETQARAMQVD